jgi:membrane fusion protein, multidrug efflux system
VDIKLPLPLIRYDQRPRYERLQSGWRSLLLLGLVSLSACAASDAQSPQSSPGKRPVPVVAAVVTRRTVPLSIQETGIAQAYSTVSVKSQVAGLLTGVYFREGQMVRQGDLLFKIDDRALKAAVDQVVANRVKAIAQVAQARAELAQAQTQVTQARANLSRDIAQANNANIQARRYTSLLNQGVVSQEQADQFRSTATAQQATVLADQSSIGNAIAAVESAQANVQNAQATVAAADAEVSTAQVQLSYASIYAPHDGQLGALNVNQGNLVKDNDTTPLVVINQIYPIYVQFTIPQRLLPDLTKYQSRNRLRVQATPPQGSSQPAVGELVFIDSNIDPTTGTIKLKASFPNRDRRLTPGQFVNVTLTLTEEPDAIVVPAPAIQTGQNGVFVYVIKSDKTVEARPVTVAQTVNNQAVIKSGLRLGEQVVVDGQFNLAPGVAVQAGVAKSGQGQQGQQGQ